MPAMVPAKTPADLAREQVSILGQATSELADSVAALVDDLTRAEAENAELRRRIEGADQLLTAAVELGQEVTDRAVRAEQRLSQFGIPLSGDPTRTWCQVCQAHFDDLPEHDYRRHGRSKLEDVEDAELVTAREWAGRLGSMWFESPSTRKEITARWSGLAWCIEHVAALAAVVKEDEG